MTRKRTPEDIKEQLDPRGILLIGEYTNNKIVTRFRCDEQHEWETSPGNVLKGDGCPTCARTRLKRTPESINIQIKKSGFEMIGDYLNIKTKTIFKCSRGHEWNAKPNDILNGKGCPHCSVNAKYSLEEFIEIASKIHNNKYDYSLVEYKCANTKVVIICPEHGKFLKRPVNHTIGKAGCRKCSVGGKSKMEQDWLDHLNISQLLRNQPLKEKSNRQVDGYDPTTNTVYQFHGDYWHGNPKVFDQNMIHPTIKISMREVYQTTLKWDQQIRDWGYNLVVMWESDYLENLSKIVE